MTPAPMAEALEVPEAVELAPVADNSYIIRPNFKDKFKPAVVKEAIQE